MDKAIAEIKEGLVLGHLAPFLGPDLLWLESDNPPVPAGARPLAHLLGTKVGIPGRIRNNLWHASQYIETHRHRVTLDRLLQEFFAPTPFPNSLQRWLSGLSLPLLVDSWYDNALTAAFAGKDNWGVIQGVSKAQRVGETPWFKAYDHKGREQAPEAAEEWESVIYKPHGGIWPAGNVLATDADYVEVLSELDIGTPIPKLVQSRRQNCGFVFLGCRFYDQILRSFARSILKYSQGPHYAVLPELELTKNEKKFLLDQDIRPVFTPLPEFVMAMI